MKKGLINLPLIMIVSLFILVIIGGVIYIIFQGPEVLKKTTLGGEEINLDIKNVYEENGNLIVDVARGVGEGQLTGIKFILSGGGNYLETIVKNSNLQESEEENFVLTPNKLSLSEIKNIFIVPIFESSDKKEIVGKITDIYNFISENQTGVTEEICSPNCIGLQCGLDSVCGQLCGTCEGTDTCTNGVCVPQKCVPDNNIITCGSSKCGTKINNCGQEVNCGICSNGQTCQQGVCQSVACIPESITITCNTWICGTKLNNCGKEVSCGICLSGNICSSGTCICTPAVNPCGSKKCGTASNGTCGTISCGTCSGTDTCSNGVCVQSLSPTYSLGDLTQANLLIIVDNTMAWDLDTELRQFKSDLEKDGYHVAILDTRGYPTKEAIRNLIQSKKDSIKGIFFVGNIPLVQYVYVNDQYLTTDYYYTDFQGVCDPYVKGGQENTITYTCESSPYLTLPKFWVARLTPPINTNQVFLLKQYFTRDHSYRLGNIQSNNNMLVYYPVTKDSGGSIFPIDESTNLFYPNIDSLPSGINNFLNKIQFPYDIVDIQAHGNQEGIYDLTNNEHLLYNQITGGNSLIYLMSSCSVGDFSNPNYFAGYMLFNTNALFVQACSIVHFGGIGIYLPDAMLLKDGMQIGDALRYSSRSHMCYGFFGDPTLRLSKKSGSQPIFSINKQIFNFGTIPASSNTITWVYNVASITNTGTSDLYVTVETFYGPSLKTNYPSNNIMEVNLAMVSHKISPGQTEKLHLGVGGNVQSGSVSGEFHLITNDPNHPVVIVPFTANVILQ